MANTEPAGLAAIPSAADSDIDGDWCREFRWRWAAFAVSEAGSALGYSALPIIAVLMLAASDFQVSLLSVLASVVSAVLALPLAPWIEHHRKLPVMITADLLQFVVLASVPVAALLGMLTYWQLCMVAVVQMVARMAFDASGVAQLRTLVPRPYRGAANGRFETTLWSVNTIGPAVGGVLISWLGATVTMVLDAVSFLISALLLRRLRKSEPAPPLRRTDSHWARDVTAGWRFIFRHRGLTGLYWNAMIFGGCILAVSPLLVVLMLRDLGFAAWHYGLVTGVAGMAGIVGSTLAKPATKRFGQHRVLVLAGIGRNVWLMLIPFAPASNLGLAMIAISQFLLVFFAGMFSPTFATYRMNATDDAHMSRVVMAWSITNKIIQPVSIAAAGVLAAATSARTAIAVLAAILLTGIPFLPWRTTRNTPPIADA